MKKALLAGCNQYRGNQLQGCINDIILIQQWLHQNGWKSSEITMLLDKDMTAAKLKTALKKLLTGNKPGDTIIFWYSGHGAQIASPDPAESDGLNETLCPVNFSFSKPTTWITDKFLRDILPQPKGVNLLMGLDSCFSGGMDKKLTRKKVMLPTWEMKQASLMS